jgi:hypothetical protein
MHFVRHCRNQIGTTLRDSTDDIEGFYHVLLFACGISLPIRSGGQPILVSHLYLLPSSRYTTFDTVGELMGALDGKEDIG